MTAWRRGKAQGSYPLQSLFLSAFEFAAFSLNKFTLYKLHRLSSYSRICQSRLKFISKWHRQLILYWADGMCPTCNPARSFCFAHFWSFKTSTAVFCSQHCAFNRWPRVHHFLESCTCRCHHETLECEVSFPTAAEITMEQTKSNIQSQLQLQYLHPWTENLRTVLIFLATGKSALRSV